MWNLRLLRTTPRILALASSSRSLALWATSHRVFSASTTVPAINLVHEGDSISAYRELTNRGCK